MTVRAYNKLKGLTPSNQTDIPNLVTINNGGLKVKDNITKAEQSSDSFHSAVKSKKAKIGVSLLAAFLGAAAISYFVAPEKAVALPKPMCTNSICL